MGAENTRERDRSLAHLLARLGAVTQRPVRAGCPRLGRLAGLGGQVADVRAARPTGRRLVGRAARERLDGHLVLALLRLRDRRDVGVVARVARDVNLGRPLVRLAAAALGPAGVLDRDALARRRAVFPHLVLEGPTVVLDDLGSLRVVPIPLADRRVAVVHTARRPAAVAVGARPAPRPAAARRVAGGQAALLRVGRRLRRRPADADVVPGGPAINRFPLPVDSRDGRQVVSVAARVRVLAAHRGWRRRRRGGGAELDLLGRCAAGRLQLGAVCDHAALTTCARKALAAGSRVAAGGGERARAGAIGSRLRRGQRAEEGQGRRRQEHHAASVPARALAWAVGRG
eukprot:SAG22_NODE_36_length_27184_cov_65.870076_8_plen_344_part_00